jgi:NRAMP (natural resistance-associated macrophage protein)-like metal ion transporter
MKKNILEKAIEMPAKLLEGTVEAAAKATGAIPGVNRMRAYWHTLGPGLTTGAADDDPSGIATYSQAGAKYGFQFLWLAVLTFPLMSLVQEMCARIGLATGKGLAANIRQHFPKPILYTCTILLFIANTFNIGADLGAMAQAMQLVLPDIPFAVFVVGFALLSIGLQIFTPYAQYAKYLKWLALVLLSYIVSALLIDLNWSEIAIHAVIPTINFSKDQILLVCAVLGTTISPYLFFWQTSQEVEERILQGKTTIKQRRQTTSEDIKNMRTDVWSGMFLSNLVMFFIIAVCGAVLMKNGITDITTSAQAAEALRPLAGNATYLLFVIGIVGTGLLAIPVLAGSSSYALSESFHWKMGLYHKLKEAYSFYGIIIISMLAGLAMNFIGLDPIKALISSAVMNGLIAPIVLVLIVILSSNKKVMTKWTNHRLTTVLGWLIVIIMTIVGVAAIVALTL